MDGLTVSQVAKLAGVSVRTLHHYDEIGLLSPSQRSGGGYRLYGDEELQRLLPQAGAEERSVTRPQEGAEEASVAPEAGAEEGEDAARRLSRGCCAGHSRWTCSPA
jgi:transposase